MIDAAELAVIGAGPAGLAAAAAAGKAGVDVVLIDDQPAPGGQIYRNITSADERRVGILGRDYAAGSALVEEFAEAPGIHLSGASVWQIECEPEPRLYLSGQGGASTLSAKRVILATGAIERPMPFPGWTLPGVLTAGAGQILLKSAGMTPAGPIVLAGSGPLLLLLAVQYLRAGIEIAALVETAPRLQLGRAIGRLPGALGHPGLLYKGLGLLSEIRKHKVPRFKGARQLQALGSDSVDGLAFKCGGRPQDVACRTLLIHQGVVPNVQMTRALGLPHVWNAAQRCWHPKLSAYGQTDIDCVSVAGDGAGIGGADVAELQGRLAGLDAARQLDAMTQAALRSATGRYEKRLGRMLRARPFLDALYAPHGDFLRPADETIVCRCEEVTAGDIRSYVGLGCLGPNQTKAFGRPGMGPCQGRFCGLTVSEIIADARGVPTDDVGYYRLRFPTKPVTLGELAALDGQDAAGS